MKAMSTRLFAAVVAVLFMIAVPAQASDDPDINQYGNSPAKNMVLDAKGLPSEWDIKTGKNVKWSQPVGSQAYAGPIFYRGKILVGTNNEGLRNPELKNDRGVIMAFDEETGEFLWQVTHKKLPETKLHDWPLQGICSTPAIENNIAYYVSNRAEIVAVDMEGFYDGENDGPYKEEEDTSKYGGDILWIYDMMGELDVFPHNLAAGSPLLVGDLVYVSTGTGVDEGHINVPSPFGPSIVVVNKKTGELVWEDASPGEKTLHGTWSNPTYMKSNGKEVVIFPGGDGIIRGHDAKTGKIYWTFDGNPKDSVWRLGGSGTRNNIISTPVVYNDLIYIGVGQDPEHGEAPAHFYAIDPSKSKGDGSEITKEAMVWTRNGEDFNRTISSAAIKDDIVYIADLSGFLYALDSKDGTHHWTYDAFAAIWGSAFVADDKIYLGDEDGDIAVIKTGTHGGGGKEIEAMSEMNLGASVYTTPVSNNGVLFILARNRVFAFAEGAQSKVGP